MSIYTINKGAHYSRFPIPVPHTGITRYKAVVNLNSNCWYNGSVVVSSGINKLCGFTYGSEHTNSYRIGWKPDHLRPEVIDLYWYQYTNGVRTSGFIRKINTNTDVLVNIIAYEDKILYNVNGTVISIPGSYKFSYGVYCFPYFGGNDTAYWTMTIELSYKGSK